MPETEVVLLPISVIILAHRADQHLERAITSCQWATEVLIIDCDCPADWATLAPQSHFKVKPCPVAVPITDFARLRNGSLRYTTQPWIFFLDSDEEVAPEGVGVLRELVMRTDVQGAAVQRIDVFHGHTLKHGETGSLWLTRLMRTQAGRWRRPVHEVLEIDGNVIKTPIVVNHTAHENIGEFWQKIVRYARLEAEHRGAGNWQTVIQMLTYPKGKFLWNYLVKGGFLDGMPGLVYAVMMSLHSLLVRAFQLELGLKNE